MRLTLGLVAILALHAAPFQASFGVNAKWDAVHGLATRDPQALHDQRASLRVEPGRDHDAYIRSTPVTLTVGESYELAGWVRTEDLQVRDLDRTPIATGASLAMASMPFDVHSESLGGTRGWTQLSLKFTATRPQDSIVLEVADGGAFSGKAWFEGVTLEEIAKTGDLPQKAMLRTFGPGYRYPKAGWIYLHIEGEPYDRGYQHGYLMAHEIEQYIDRCAAQLDPKSKAKAWENGRTTADALFLRGFDQEILQEMKGIADGAAAAGAQVFDRRIDLVDVVTLNTITELGELHEAMPMTPTGLEGFGFRRPRGDIGTENEHGHCSAFAACGRATRDGKMVIGHVTWWPETLAEQTNLMLDVQPTTGHRVLMQSYPGGIQSGTDWYQNDLGIVLTETTIDQSPFNIQGTPVAYRARHSIQYGDSIDKVVELLKTRNNGLYTNEWIIGDSRSNEIAMLELGTYRTRLYRSSKNDWFGGTEGFYWGCNNAKDLNVRLEYQPDPHGEPNDIPFVPSARDIKWQEMYRQFKGSIDESFAFLAFRSAPLVSASTMDAKVTTAEMAPQMMLWALFGKPNQREWVPSARNDYPENKGLYSSGYKLFRAEPAQFARQVLSQPPAPMVSRASAPEAVSVSSDSLWKGWILPASDADVWFTAGSAAYWEVLRSRDPGRELDAYAAQYRAAALPGDVPLSQLKSSTLSSKWHTIAEAKGVLLLDALRREMGDGAFLALMREYFSQNTTHSVHAADFVAAAGADRQAFFAKWLNGTGLPGVADGPIYTANALRRHLASAIIVYGTMAEAGANRYAAEQWQKEFLEQYESAAPIRKDFEVSPDDLAGHDVVFVGRPETNSALAAWAKQVGLDYQGGVFRVDGRQYGSENDALLWTAANPRDREHMVVVAAGNSPLSTVLASRERLGAFQFEVLKSGEPVESGFDNP
ncbi:MAG TPA: C45 family autoproteolytic acyltransferase/hydrolase [Bryobacteraceae bacterium]|nr:C45 family autoproteolytic acyltransferase/hydrolase [Bryobacteraceae bacterium]